MVENIGFPNYILDDKLIDEEYKDVSEMHSVFPNPKTIKTCFKAPRPYVVDSGVRLTSDTIKCTDLDSY